MVHRMELIVMRSTSVCSASASSRSSVISESTPTSASTSASRCEVAAKSWDTPPDRIRLRAMPLQHHRSPPNRHTWISLTGHYEPVARSVRYADAVRLLGGETETFKRLDRLLGGALLAASTGALATGAPVAAAVGAAALSLFDAKAEFIRLGHEAIAALRPALPGATRLTRTERL